MLAVGAALLGGAAAGAVVATAVEAAEQPTPPEPRLFGADVVPFHGEHQAGVETPQQAHTWFVGLDLRDGQQVADVQRLMAVWTEDASRLTAVGYGSTRPLVTPEATDADRQTNRRVEFVVTV